MRPLFGAKLGQFISIFSNYCFSGENSIFKPKTWNLQDHLMNFSDYTKSNTVEMPYKSTPGDQGILSLIINGSYRACRLNHTYDTLYCTCYCGAQAKLPKRARIWVQAELAPQDQITAHKQLSANEQASFLVVNECIQIFSRELSLINNIFPYLISLGTEKVLLL